MCCNTPTSSQGSEEQNDACTLYPLPSQAECTTDFGQLAASTVATLSGVHISLDAYAIYFVALDVLVSLLPWGIGLLLGGTLFIVVYRYRRVFGATERQKTKWAVYGIVDLSNLSAHLVHAVEVSMQPTHVSLWLRPSEPVADSKYIQELAAASPGWRGGIRAPG
jgi:hypothetical protein